MEGGWLVTLLAGPGSVLWGRTTRTGPGALISFVDTDGMVLWSQMFRGALAHAPSVVGDRILVPVSHEQEIFFDSGASIAPISDSESLSAVLLSATTGDYIDHLTQQGRFVKCGASVRDSGAAHVVCGFFGTIHLTGGANYESGAAGATIHLVLSPELELESSQLLYEGATPFGTAFSVAEDRLCWASVARRDVIFGGHLINGDENGVPFVSCVGHELGGELLGEYPPVSVSRVTGVDLSFGSELGFVLTTGQGRIDQISVLALRANGEPVWSRSFSKQGGDFLTGAVTSGGSVLVATSFRGVLALGTTTERSESTNGVVWMMNGEDGETAWSRAFEPSGIGKEVIDAAVNGNVAVVVGYASEEVYIAPDVGDTLGTDAAFVASYTISR